MDQMRLIDDRPLVAGKFSARVISKAGPLRELVVSGEAVGDNRAEDVLLQAVPRQDCSHILTLEVASKPKSEPDHRKADEKVWPLLYVENPAQNHYTEVKIHNGTQRFLVNIIFA